MSKEVLWSPASENDLNEIFEYLKLNWNTQIVLKFISKIEDNISIIMENPKIFPLINSDLNIRKSVITKHNTLFYREKEHTIEIIRLFDSRQDPKKLKFPMND